MLVSCISICCLWDYYLNYSFAVSQPLLAWCMYQLGVSLFVMNLNYWLRLASCLLGSAMVSDD
jgi:hypothetical protein